MRPIIYVENDCSYSYGYKVWAAVWAKNTANAKVDIYVNFNGQQLQNYTSI